jgi:hypothetical protein
MNVRLDFALPDGARLERRRVQRVLDRERDGLGTHLGQVATMRLSPLSSTVIMGLGQRRPRGMRCASANSSSTSSA